MTLLRIYPEDNSGTSISYTEIDDIANQLREADVLFERWQADSPLAADAEQEEILKAYDHSIETLKNMYNFSTADVIALTPDHPDKQALRDKFLSEHKHSDFEVRFFVEGQGLFFIHHEQKVYGILCTAGDLISVPANTAHWFDMGAAPHLKCIRLFTDPSGWVAQYTGSDIADRFPRFETFDS